MKKRYQAIIVLILTAFIITGCTSESSKTENQDDNTMIHTSIYPIQYAVERIGGEAVDAESVYPPGVDSHTYEPASKEITAIAESDAFIYLGSGMEAFAETAADALESQDVKLVELGTNEELFHQDENDAHNHDDHNHTGNNPHIWLDPLRMADMAYLVKEQLVELDPDNQALYSENFNDLKDDLHTLDQQFAETLEDKENKHVLVSHAAYDYWEERYGIEQIAIRGLSSNDEPSQKELTKIIDQAKQHNMDHVLFEQNGSDQVSEIIQEQIGAKPLYLHNLSVLTEDDITNNEDYLSLMTQNLNVLDQATK